MTDEHLMCHRVTSQPKKPKAIPEIRPGSIEGPGSFTFRANLMVESSVQMISVEVLAHNVLGRSESDTYNFTLSDIGMEATPTHHPLQTI